MTWNLFSWIYQFLQIYCCCCSVAKSCPMLCYLMGCSMLGSSVLHCLPEFSQTHVNWVSYLIQPSNHLILCCLLLLLPSTFPSIRVFFNDLALRVRWPKYWGFRFSISPSKEYSGLISFRIDWFDLFADQRTLKSLLQHHNSKASILRHSVFLWSNSHIHTWLVEKPLLWRTLKSWY